MELQKIAKNLKKFYKFESMSKSVMFVRELNGSQIMTQLLISPDFPGSILVSSAINYKNPPALAMFIYELMCQANIKIAEPFYESVAGEISFGDNAIESLTLENDSEFLKAVVAYNTQPI